MRRPHHVSTHSIELGGPAGSLGRRRPKFDADWATPERSRDTGAESPRQLIRTAAPVKAYVRGVLQALLPEIPPQPSTKKIIDADRKQGVADTRDLALPFRLRLAPEIERSVSAPPGAHAGDSGACGADTSVGLPAASPRTTERIAELAQPHKKYGALRARIAPTDALTPPDLDRTLHMIHSKRVMQSTHARHVEERKGHAKAREADARQAFVQNAQRHRGCDRDVNKHREEVTNPVRAKERFQCELRRRSVGEFEDPLGATNRRSSASSYAFGQTMPLGAQAPSSVMERSTVAQQNVAGMYTPYSL